MTPREVFDGARLRAARLRPYYRRALWALVPVEQPGLGTIGCDVRWRCYWDPAQVVAWGPVLTAGVLIHEIGHLLRSHHVRCARAGHEPRRSNVASDLELNGSHGLVGEGIQLPANMYTPSRLKLPEGKLMEEYYHLLEEGQGQAADGSGADSSGEEGLSASSSSPSSQPAEVAQQQRGDAQGKQPSAPSHQGTSGPVFGGAAGSGQAAAAGRPCPSSSCEPRDCGSCAGGPPRPYEVAGDDVPSISPATADIIRRQVAQEVIDASTSRGTVPAGALRWAEEIIRPTIPTQVLLRAAVRSSIAQVSGCHDYSYARPSRRQAGLGGAVILPTMRRPEIRVALQIDTSGSVSDKMLGRAIGWVLAAVQATGQPIDLISCDAAATVTRRVTPLAQVKAALVGGGGTDMRVGIEAACALRPRPNLLVVLTDGETPWPSERPPVPVVVVTLDKRGDRPSWATIVEGWR